MLRNTVLLFPSRGHTAASTRPYSSYPVEVFTGDAELEANEDGQGCRLPCSAPSPLGRIIRHSFDTRISFDQGAARLATS
jgi:hypothetical protein